MTQPLPTAQEQIEAAQSVYATYEPQLYQAYLDMMTAYLAAIHASMFAGGVTRLALMPDPFTVFAKTPKWAELTRRYEAGVAHEILVKPYYDLGLGGTAFHSRPFVRNWIAARQNKLAQTPSQVFSIIQEIINAAVNNGASIPDIAAQIEQLLDTTHGDTWTNRATVVARTELISAYNGGLNDAFTMLADAQPDIVYVKRWLATNDTRTRPDHREADGQVVPFSQPFVVGGYAMMHPGDPTAPPHEVIQCRCTMLMEEEGQSTNMTNRGYKLSAAAQKDDHQSTSGSDQTLTLSDACTFCLATHKPGLCKGQKRGGTEPEPSNGAQAHATALKGLAEAAARANQIAMTSPDPKTRAAARKAAAGYAKAMHPHQQNLDQAARQGDRDTREQDTLNRRVQTAKGRLANHYQREKDRAAQQAKLKKMSPKQRAAYTKAQAAKAKADRVKALKDAVTQAEKDAMPASANAIIAAMGNDDYQPFYDNGVPPLDVTKVPPAKPAPTTTVDMDETGSTVPAHRIGK